MGGITALPVSISYLHLFEVHVQNLHPCLGRPELTGPQPVSK